ncbi:very short patch repair endonuclease [Acidihalobacter aeolianus]|uniref:Very short patch repair endonuclease n=1 Tax=Acidihalobacter aeolianus TaxID=2792603 RepID=A0A1D8KA68_9GAMM|nr:DNA mismatch endonuclease Vsr [Acidihalobacter aeolianus]AOV17837.1 very short patch repair endonuclease [Acidihalobacter aeolianus]
MADVVDAATRSRMMAGIRGQNTKPEILVRSLLHREGFRYRLHVKELPGKPDIVLPKYCAVIFVHGCFWHGHDCPLYRLPGTRRDFWQDKIDRNRDRDRRVRNALLAACWRVAVVWECALRGAEMDSGQVAQRLAGLLRGNEKEMEIKK